jgi:hypothetical protein
MGFPLVAVGAARSVAMSGQVLDEARTTFAERAPFLHEPRSRKPSASLGWKPHAGWALAIAEGVTSAYP